VNHQNIHDAILRRFLNRRRRRARLQVKVLRYQSQLRRRVTPRGAHATVCRRRHRAGNNIVLRHLSRVPAAAVSDDVSHTCRVNGRHAVLCHVTSRQQQAYITSSSSSFLLLLLLLLQLSFFVY